MATTTSAVDGTNYDTQGYISVTWTNAEKLAGFYAWRVYRRIRNDQNTAYGAWVMIYQTTADVPSYEYRDYTAPSNKAVQYTVVQATGASGETEDAKDNIRTITPDGTNYWLIHPTDATKNLLLAHVTEDTFNEEIEEELLVLIGRGRKSDQGTVLGVAGTLSCEIRDRATTSLLRARKREGDSLYLRNPFGDIWLVNIGAPEVNRTRGVGVREYNTVTFMYSEVA